MQIGQGTYSSVYKARDLQNDRIVAIKKVRFVNMDPESVRFMAREICILRRLDHPNCMKLQALVTSKFSGTLYLVFDYMEHDLAGLLQTQKVKKFTLPQVSFFLVLFIFNIYNGNLKTHLVHIRCGKMGCLGGLNNGSNQVNYSIDQKGLGHFELTLNTFCSL